MLQNFFLCITSLMFLALLGQVLSLLKLNHAVSSIVILAAVSLITILLLMREKIVAKLKFWHERRAAIVVYTRNRRNGHRRF